MLPTFIEAAVLLLLALSTEVLMIRCYESLLPSSFHWWIPVLLSQVSWPTPLPVVIVFWTLLRVPERILRSWDTQALRGLPHRGDGPVLSPTWGPPIRAFLYSADSGELLPLFTSRSGGVLSACRALLSPTVKTPPSPSVTLSNAVICPLADYLTFLVASLRLSDVVRFTTKVIPVTGLIMIYLRK